MNVRRIRQTILYYNIIKLRIYTSNSFHMILRQTNDIKKVKKRFAHRLLHSQTIIILLTLITNTFANVLQIIITSQQNIFRRITSKSKSS